MLGAIAVHIAVVALLLYITIHVPQVEEGGLSVAMGMVENAQGYDDPEELVDVDVMKPAEAVPETPVPADDVDELITQDEEPTVAVPEKKKTEKKPEKKPETKKPEAKKAEKTPEQIEAEKRQKAAEEAERKRKAAEKAANSKIQGAFGKGRGMNKGNSDAGRGIQGSRDGNAAEGAASGVEQGYGTFELGGRSLGPGGLPKPEYRVQEEGKVVVTIVVNPAGAVVGTPTIAPGTNTVSRELRSAAIKAARKARFNEVQGVNNQQGTITYYFKLK